MKKTIESRFAENKVKMADRYRFRAIQIHRSEKDEMIATFQMTGVDEICEATISITRFGLCEIKSRLLFQIESQELTFDEFMRRFDNPKYSKFKR